MKNKECLIFFLVIRLRGGYDNQATGLGDVCLSVWWL